MVDGNMGVFLIGLIMFTLNFDTVISNLYDLPLMLLTNESEGMNEIITLPDGEMECGLGYFGCNETRPLVCIQQVKMCDGTVDCVDGTDEWNCEDPINNYYFDHFYRKNPAAQSDDIKIGECVWENVFNRTKCHCKGYDLDCRNSSFQKLPSHLPDGGITLLDLTENNFSVLNKGFFDGLPDVEKLVLSHCKIREILSDAFRVLSDVDVDIIYLNQNQISALPEKFFPPGTRLQILILRGNAIAELPITSFANLDHLIELDLGDNRIVSFNAEVFEPLINLEILMLNSNKIKKLTSNMIPPMSNLFTLNLDNNSIESISNKALQFPSLRDLYLAGNKLKKILNDTFVYLPNLVGLVLNDNEINEFQLASFHGVYNLTSLSLGGNNPFHYVSPNVFKHLVKLDHVYFRWFHLCRGVLHVRVCSPKTDGISSNLHLLDNSLLRRSVWVMAGISLFGNMLVLLGRCFIRSKRGYHNIEHDLFLKNLAASDLLMGVYLSIIATTDIQFRGEYLLHDLEWRQSFTCSLCGFLSTLSCQSSTLILSLVTWDRLICVTRPLQPRSSSKVRAILRLSILWLVACVAAASPFLYENYFGAHFYGNNGVCLSVHIHDPFSKGWEYSACLFIFVNTMALLFIVFSYAAMLKAIRGSGEAMRSTVCGRENAVARRFAIIVATDCACWLPIIVVKLVALNGVNIPASLYAWLAVFVLPVNSALNPVLYTLTTAAFKQQMNKIYSTCGGCGKETESHNNNGIESGMSFSLGHNPHIDATKHLLQRRTTQTTLTFSCKRPTIV